jgi:hypothetical protein
VKLLILGHARHGKDTVAGILKEEFGLTHLASSESASTIFIFDTLKEKYGYRTVDECFEDRVNHREEWYDLICEYNAGDPAKLAKQIVQQANIYVGMRSQVELAACIEQGVFDAIIGVMDPRKPLEAEDSMSIDVTKHSDLMIYNEGTLEELRASVIKAYRFLKAKVESKRNIQERKARLREYWNGLKPFTSAADIPQLPRIDDPEEWNNFYVVKLIEAGAIPKSLLKDGEYYIGDHRQATVAKWCAANNEFEYWRTKFSARYIDTCNHFEDDNGYSLFVPIAIATQEQFERNAE